MSSNRSRFGRFARETSRAAGRPAAFMLALSIVLLWVVTGPMFGFSDTWQLVINTGTTVVTFLMVFLIQATQNRDSEALQVKIDELIRATEGAHNALLDLEEIEEEQMDLIQQRYKKLAEQARLGKKTGHPDTDRPNVDDGDG
jgi:low affinity Fe/Cu permease